MKSLSLLVSQASLLEQKLIESAGEITEEIQDMLSVRDEQLPEKVDGYSIVLDRFAALEAYYKERAQFFSEIAKRCEAVQDHLKTNIKNAMTELNVTELSGHDIKFTKTRVKPRLIIEDESKIPKEYKQDVITTKVDKDRLREDLAVGPIDGAHLEESFSLKIYGASLKPKTKGVKNVDEL